MKNPYINSSTQYSEVAVTLQDFKYGDTVKCIIPSLMPMVNQNEPIDKSRRTQSSKIMNKNRDILGLTEYVTCNYIELTIPSQFSNNEKNGKKGDEFIVLFVGGNINKCSIIGRVD